jgi:hypothetical protein
MLGGSGRIAAGVSGIVGLTIGIGVRGGGAP